MISLSNVSKKFGTGVSALTDISFEVEKGEFVFLIGPTGSGKTTIFKLLIHDMLPTSGEITVDDYNVSHLSKEKISHLRKKIGVIFQDLKLLMDRTIFENVVLPLEICGIETKHAAKITEEVMTKIGIIEHRDKFPIQLSGGELQKTAIARALTLSPEILLADEPTGNLDPETSIEIVKLLEEINKKGTTIIMATHNENIIKSSSRRVINLSKGELVDKDGKPIKKPAKQTEEKSDIIDTKEKVQEKEPEKNKSDEDF